MVLDNFILEEYNEKNIEHKSLLINLGNDFKIQRYLGNLEMLYEFLNRNNKNGLVANFYVAFFNKIPVGIITINQYSNTYEISYAILNIYRKQHFGSLLLSEFSKKIFEQYNDIDSLDLRINIKNIASQKLALFAGYENICGDIYTLKRSK